MAGLDTSLGTTTQVSRLPSVTRLWPMSRRRVFRTKTTNISLLGSYQSAAGRFALQYAAAFSGVSINSEGATHSRTRMTLNSCGGFTFLLLVGGDLTRLAVQRTYVQTICFFEVDVVIDHDDLNPGRDAGDILYQSSFHGDVDGFHGW